MHRQDRPRCMFAATKRALTFCVAVSMLAAGCSDPELDRLQAEADQSRAAMINSAINPDPRTGIQLFLPNEQVNCTTFWGAFGEHQFVTDAKSCVENRRYNGMEPVDKAAHDQRLLNESTRYTNALLERQRAAEAAAEAQRQQAARLKAASLDNAQAGLQALNAGDSARAVSLFTDALNGGGLSQSDTELALVKRGEAYLNLGNTDSARADLQHALQIDPSDREAASALQQ